MTDSPTPPPPSQAEREAANAAAVYVKHTPASSLGSWIDDDVHDAFLTGVAWEQSRSACMRFALLAIAKSTGPCHCGEEPYTDGEQCPICFAITMLEKLGV